MDGNYNSSVVERFKRADTIFFFDFPRRASMYGVIKRRIQFRNKHREEMPDDWQEKITFKFLLFVWNYRRVNRKTTMEALHETTGKDIFIFNNREQTHKYLEKLSGK